MLISRLCFLSLTASLVRSDAFMTNEQTADMTEPCAMVGKLQAAGQTYFPAELALSCMRSIPLDTVSNAKQLEGLQVLLEWHSTLAFLKSPTPGYIYPKIDVLASLDELEDRLNTTYYSNEYDFQRDIFSVIQKTHDTHLGYLPDVLGVFRFVRQINGVPFDIFSVSENGTSLPNIYAFRDQTALVLGNASDYNPSPIATIDDQEVEMYLNSLAQNEAWISTFHDPDASYNALFPNIPSNVSHAGSAVIGSTFTQNLTYFGNVTSIKFVNGTALTIPIMAVTQQDFSNVTTGSDLLAACCRRTLSLEDLLAAAKAYISPPSSTNSTTITNSTVSDVCGSTSSAVGQKPYPCPFSAASDNSIAGYFPALQIDDLVVLSLPRYDPKNSTEFSDVILDILTTAAANNKTRLIIDLRGNEGGSITDAYDTFKQLFPAFTPYGTTNLRANTLLDIIGQSVNKFFDESRNTNLSMSDTFERGNYAPFQYHHELDATNASFSSWSDLFGPHEIHYDNFTSLLRYNLSDALSTGQPPNAIYGYGDNTRPRPQFFQSDNIVLLQDGTCTSACTIFTEFMKSQAGVKQIVVGGRKQYGPMQGVGGTKGAQDVAMIAIVAAYYAAYLDTDMTSQALLNQTFGGLDGWFFDVAGHAIARVAGSPVSATFNLRNNIRQNDKTNTPLQFVYEAADCRFFYTPAMYSDQEAIWNMAYNVAWRHGECVRDSTGQISATQGVDYILSPFPVLMGNDTLLGNSTQIVISLATLQKGHSIYVFAITATIVYFLL